MHEVSEVESLRRSAGPLGARLALALGGGAARGLAHIGVLEVFEREGIRPDCVVGSSMGGLIGALSAAGLRARDIADLARGFRFSRWFLPGGTVAWDTVFAPAVPILATRSFEELDRPLVVTAVDLEEGTQVILRAGPVLPAVRATCAVPGVLPAVQLGGRWLVDGGLVNILPVDVAWMVEPDVVVAVKVGAARARKMPELSWWLTTLFSRLGTVIPNPGTAKLTFEVLVRAAEITLDRQTALATAMTGPEVLIEPELGNIGLRDFDRLDDAVQAGRRAAEAVLPELCRLLEAPPRVQVRSELVLTLRFDPVCAMVISPGRARAKAEHRDVTYYFCSPNCRDRFEQEPELYLGNAHENATGGVRS
jgi:NTE family protein